MATIVLVYFAVAADRRDRRVVNRQMAAETAVAAPRNWRNRLADFPWRRIVAGIGASIFFVLTLAQIFMADRATVQVPPGPLSEADHATIIATAKIPWLEKQKARIQELSAQYSSRGQELLAGYVAYSQPEAPMAKPRSQPKPTLYPLQSIGNTIQQMAKDDLGLIIDLQKHPNFDRNPLIHEVNEEKISTDEEKGEYRSMADQISTSSETIKGLVASYDKKIAEYEAQIDRFARDH